MFSARSGARTRTIDVVTLRQFLPIIRICSLKSTRVVSLRNAQRCETENENLHQCPRGMEKFEERANVDFFSQFHGNGQLIASFLLPKSYETLTQIDVISPNPKILMQKWSCTEMSSLRHRYSIETWIFFRWGKMSNDIDKSTHRCDVNQCCIDENRTCSRYVLTSVNL